MPGGIPGGSPLPIQKIELIGYPTSNGNQLEWRTDTYKNVKELILERSKNSIDFEKIYSVEAYQTDYAYTDNQLSHELYYYRVKRIYKDGNYDYSNTLQIYHPMSEHVAVYPNPTKETLWIRYKTKEQKDIQVRLTNLTGQVVKNFSKTVFPGIQEWNLNLSDLPTGMYMLHVFNHTPIKIVKE